MDLFDLAAKISLDTSEYEKSLKNANAASKVLADAFKNVSAETKTLQNSTSVLTEGYDKAAEQLPALEKELTKSADESENFSDESKKLAQQLSSTENEAEELKDQLDKLAKTSGQTSESEKEVGEEAKKTGNEAEKAGQKVRETGKEIKKTGEEAKEAGEKTSIFAQVLKANLATEAITAAISGLKKLTSATINFAKSSIESYAEYEQLVGGVETLFKDNADVVQRYANDAFKTSGLSANQYMETVTSFSASLLQSLGGDTSKAAEYADRAIVDMSDKMLVRVKRIEPYQGCGTKRPQEMAA